MYLSRFGIMATMWLIQNLVFTVSGNAAARSDHLHATDDIALSCCYFWSTTAFDGREWIGEPRASKFMWVRRGESECGVAYYPFFLSADIAPYYGARMSRSQFSYTFVLWPGQKFIRLHFYPATYHDFERSAAFFTVKAGPHTLLSNFSASLAADDMAVKYFAKEFCITIEEKQPFTITFSPSSAHAYAFVNGIEIVSMPAGLYYTPHGDSGAPVVGKNHHFYIDNATALELVHRLNVGGKSILPVEDVNMYRMWLEDRYFHVHSDALPLITAVMIKYTSIPMYVAPMKLYQSTWSIDPTKQPNKLQYFTWRLPVNLGFRYLIRLHFCEIELDLEPTSTTGTVHKGFNIIINYQIAEAIGNVIKWSGGNGVAAYRDYVAAMEGEKMEGDRDLVLTLLSVPGSQLTDAVLKGIEIFKLANLDNSLAGPNPAPPRDASNSKITEPPKSVLSMLRSRNVTAPIAACIITVLFSIIVHQSNVWKSSHGQLNIDSSKEDEEGQELEAEQEQEEVCRKFSLADIEFATNNFADELIIGNGGFGKVYKGIMDNGNKTVAIKRLKSQSNQGAEEFWAEIETLSKFRYIHLLPLIGYCDDNQEMLLVYPYMANGTLDDHLHKRRCGSEGNSSMPWEQRLKICIDASRGLNFLHTGGGNNRGIIHRDVKSSNILLDENWVAKISDFGLCKIFTPTQSQTHVSTIVKGTFGYLDPDYFMNQRLTRKSDVFAFGVVLFEVLCGRPAVKNANLEQEEQRSLALWVQHCLKKGTLDHIVDPSVRDQISPPCFKAFVEIASKCLHEDPTERPTMAELVESLEFALELQKKATAASVIHEDIMGCDGWDWDWDWDWDWNWNWNWD